jgi:excisionase family DNA binding protein
MSSNIEIQKICELCGNDFIARTTVTRFCSNKCSSNAYKLRTKNNKINKVIKETNKQKILSITELNHEAIKTKDFLSIKEAYTLIGVSERTFYRILKAGTIRFAKVGKRTIIKRSEIDKLFVL